MPPTDDLDETPVQLRAADAANDYDAASHLSDMYLQVVGSPSLTRQQLRNAGYADDEIDYSTRVFEWRGLIERLGEDDWQVLPPEISMPSFAARLEDHARQLRSAAPHMARLYQQAVTEESGPPIGLAALRGLPEITAAIAAVSSACRHKLRLLRADTPATRHLLTHADRARPRTTGADGAPIVLESIYDLALLDVPEFAEQIAARAAEGEVQRIAPSMPFSVTLSDEGRVVIDTVDPDGVPVGMALTAAGGAAAANRLVEIAWRLATPWNNRDADGAGRDRQILQLMAGGSSDAVIARQLGISQRTVERRIRAYMDQVNAVTRFQAGVWAVRRGDV